ncbi:DUF3991 domain-containing protein [Enterococcus faecium]|nr:DUF3991 domain-containing protein [Enterococcus faecium]
MKNNEYKEILAEAKKVTITSVMDDQGMEYIDMKNFAQGVEHDSLMIDKRKNYFYWNSQIENGKVVQGDVIEFVCRFYDMSHLEALNYLTQERHEKLTKVETRSKPKEPFKYYFEHNTSFSEVSNYLVNERKLSKTLVSVLHEKGFIQEDKYKRAIFVWSDTGKAVGASIIGTEYNPQKYERGRFKGIARNSEANFGFNLTIGTPNKLYIFEAPVDMLSYWTMNPQLENCMLASMDGLKEQSVYKFISQMYISKGSLPHEGIYLGVDNDPAGHRFFDNLSKLSYVINETKQEIKFKKLIPNDLDIPKKNISMYQEAAKVYQVDWLAIAATHKALTNFSEEGKIANSWNVKEYFSEGTDIALESKKVGQKLATIRKESGEYDFQKLFRIDEGMNPIELRGLHEKVSTYYEDYRNLGYRPTGGMIKDWNDALRYKIFVQQEAKLLESIYERNGKERMKIFKDEERKKYIAISQDKHFTEPFFEADSPEEAAILVKNYGFQAVDKEDRMKYHTEKSPQIKSQEALMMSR